MDGVEIEKLSKPIHAKIGALRKTVEDMTKALCLGITDVEKAVHALADSASDLGSDYGVPTTQKADEEDVRMSSSDLNYQTAAEDEKVVIEIGQKATGPLRMKKSDHRKVSAFTFYVAKMSHNSALPMENYVDGLIQRWNEISEESRAAYREEAAAFKETRSIFPK